MLDFLQTFGLRDLIDVILMAFLLYTIIVWGRLARVGRILSGLGSLGLIYVLARQFELQLTVRVFQGLFAVLAIVLIVIFQTELRQLFERLAAWSIGDWDRSSPDQEATEPLISAVSRLASARMGALIVIPGRDSIERHVAGGIPLDAIVSSPLIESIFDKHSPGHDGALLLHGSRASHFALHLPLSTDFAQLKGRGTRHAAALGLAERADALCIVVSEERGLISVARDGAIQELRGTAELGSCVEAFLKEKSASSPSQAHRRVLSLRKHWIEKIAAILIAAVLWIAFVSDFGGVTRTLTVPVVVQNVPLALRATQIAPAQVSVILRASRAAFQRLDPGLLGLTVDARELNAGRHSLQAHLEDVQFPPGIEIVEVDPEFVELVLIEALDAEEGSDELP
jgi:diadenylate cyclase